MFVAGRAFEQVRNTVGYPHLNVKIGATHAGISVGEDGASHQCNEDIALMRTIPGMTVIVPADDVEAKAAVEAAINYQGPVYLRFGRAAVAVATMKGKSYLQIGSICMGIAGSSIDTDFFEEYLGMRVESVDEVEIIRRMTNNIYDEKEFLKEKRADAVMIAKGEYRWSLAERLDYVESSAMPDHWKNFYREAVQFKQAPKKNKKQEEKVQCQKKN